MSRLEEYQQQSSAHFLSQMAKIERALADVGVELVFGPDGCFRRVHKKPESGEVTAELEPESTGFSDRLHADIASHVMTGAPND